MANKAKYYGILVNYKSEEWNALDVLSTTRLCNSWFAMPNLQERLLIVSNFRGVDSKVFSSSIDSFQRIVERLAVSIPSVAVWIEPGPKPGFKFLKSAYIRIFADLRKLLGFESVY